MSRWDGSGNWLGYSESDRVFYFGRPAIVIRVDGSREPRVLIGYVNTHGEGMEFTSGNFIVNSEHLRKELNDESLMLDTELLMEGVQPVRIHFEGDRQ